MANQTVTPHDNLVTPTIADAFRAAQEIFLHFPKIQEEQGYDSEVICKEKIASPGWHFLCSPPNSHSTELSRCNRSAEDRASYPHSSPGGPTQEMTVATATDGRGRHLSIPPPRGLRPSRGNAAPPRL